MCARDAGHSNGTHEALEIYAVLQWDMGPALRRSDADGASAGRVRGSDGERYADYRERVRGERARWGRRSAHFGENSPGAEG